MRLVFFSPRPLVELTALTCPAIKDLVSRLILQRSLYITWSTSGSSRDVDLSHLDLFRVDLSHLVLSEVDLSDMVIMPGGPCSPDP